MDYFKRKTINDYTAQDLNCPYVHIHNRSKAIAKIHRKARRALKQELRNYKGE